MENYKLLINDARKAFDTADHLTYVTFPLIKESKLMITITEHINMAVSNATQALLEYERMYKRISYIPNEFMTRMDMLRRSVLPRYGLQDFGSLIMDVRNIVESHKKSNMEFVRREKLFIYSNGYANFSSVNIEGVKNYLGKTRDFIGKVARITGENERRTR